MKNVKHSTARGLILTLLIALLLSGCGDGGDLLADGGIIGTGSIVGTVPGTIIEAYGDQGEYFQTSSEFNNTDQHPFQLRLKARVGFYLVMIINEGTENEIVMPIAFPGNKAGDVLVTRILLHEGEVIDLGHIPLFMNCSEVLESDPNEDCVESKPFILNKPFVLNEAEGSKNPLKKMDADDDGIYDFDDDDHGYGHPSEWQLGDPQDHDNDGVPNYYDDDFIPGPNDEDEDGIDDDDDKNSGNWDGRSMHPVGQDWVDEHGEYAENYYAGCASCHGDDFLGSPLSTVPVARHFRIKEQGTKQFTARYQVGCYDCHDGPDPEDYDDDSEESEDDD
ncbi:MAG: hypothetical protein IME97_06640 [Proteobacteria bacterium]|nr:hypothetical protein [Pseudomonadota bacterium]